MSSTRTGTPSAEPAHLARSPLPDDPELERRFRKLADEWQADVAHLSSMSARVQHPSYREIISLDPAAVPLLLRELERRPSHWFAALRSLTGDDPVDPADRGHLGRMAQAWIEWGKEHGYLLGDA